VTEEDRLLTFVDDTPVVVVDAGLDGHDVRVHGGVLVVAKALLNALMRNELWRAHGATPDEEWNILSNEEISQYVLERACPRR